MNDDSREYYDRKLKHAEEVLPYVAAFWVGVILAMVVHWLWF